MPSAVPPPDVSPWTGLEVIEPVTNGNRNAVWRGRIGDRAVAVRRARRSADSLEWELTLLEHLDTHGFRVPVAVPTDNGNPTADGLVVQTWLEGRPPSSNADWTAVADELRRLHTVTVHHRQRPDCCTVRELADHRRSVDADLDAMPSVVAERIVQVFEQFDGVPTSVVHGDPGADNIVIDDAGSVGLIDWDESRVDLIWHDLSNLGVQVLAGVDHRRAQRLSDAWEAANGWIDEPAYAARRFERLLES